MIFAVLLGAGFSGLVVMALLGFAHGPAMHRHGRVTAAGRGGRAGHGARAVPPRAAAARAPLLRGARHGAAPARGHAPAHAHAHAPAHSAAPAAPAKASFLSRGLFWLAPVIDPITWFSLLFGAGLGGAALSLFGVPAPGPAAAAVAGGILFPLLVVRPVWNVIFRFESTPAGNLESCLLQEVEAVTAFNARGEGLVRVRVDGRSEDVLARLVDEERARESRPRRGDRLVIEEVDPRTNTCLVSRGS